MSSINTHVKVVAWLHILLGVLCLLGAMFVGTVAGLLGAVIAGGATGHALPGFLGLIGIGGIAFILVGVFAVPHLLVGWGLLNGKEWARIIGIIVSILSLLHPVVGLGTAIAIYSLVILFSGEASEMLGRTA
jgi:hypothetical protein